MSDFALRVNGKAFGGWQSIRVTRSIESIAGSFDLSVTDRWANQSKPWEIREEDECSVIVNGTTVITGYVDERSLSYSADDHSLSVSGRDRTGSLVDCSAKLEHWEYLDTDVLTFVRRIANAFGISVSVQTGLNMGPTPTKLTIEPGETAFDAIEKACRHAAVLAVSDGKGGMLLCRAGAAHAASSLVEGQNIISASARFNVSGRFRKYYVLGQHSGSDHLPDETAASIEATAEDETVKRTSRVLVVRPEGDVTTTQAQQRAQWEASVRASRGDTVQVTVHGWRQSTGAIWPVNAFVQLKSPTLGIKAASLLITEVTYSLDQSGEMTTLSLKRPDAFKPQPIIDGESNHWKEIVHGV